LGGLKVTKPPAGMVPADGLRVCGEKPSSDTFQPLMLTAAESALYSSTVSSSDDVTSLIRTFW
jgi:hypothetical protein